MYCGKIGLYTGPFSYVWTLRWASLVAQGFPGDSVIICLPMQETPEMRVRPLRQEVPLEEKMATHSSILARIIPWTEEPGGL